MAAVGVDGITINGVKYVQADAVQTAPRDVNGLECVLVRTRSAGVFVGYLQSRRDTPSGLETTLINARRIWYWAGAATLSQLAMQGTTRPTECKFPVSIDKIILPESIEIIEVTAKAKASIDSVPIWEA